MEKPVHHHEQDNDSEQPGGGLHVQRGEIFRKIADDPDSNKPGDQGSKKCARRANHHGSALMAIFTDHARDDGRQYQDGFEPFAKNQHPDVQDSGAMAGVWGDRVRIAMGRQTLPNQHGSHQQGRSEEKDSNCSAHEL